MRSLRALAIYAVLTVAFYLAVRGQPARHGRGGLRLLRLGDRLDGPRAEDRPRAAAPREHLPPSAVHARDGRAGPRHDPARPAARRLHRRRGAPLQRGPAAHLPLLGAHGLLAGEGAGGGGVGRPPRRRRSSPSRRSAPTRSAHLSTLGTQWWPLVLLFTIRFAVEPDEGRSPRRALLRPRVPGLRLPRGDRGRGAAAVPAGVVLGSLGPAEGRRPGGRPGGSRPLPVYRMHQSALAPERYVRGTEETTLYSAPVESFLSTSPWNRVYGEVTDAFRTVGPNNLFPGLVVPGLVAGRRDRGAPEPGTAEPGGRRPRGAAPDGSARGPRPADSRLRLRPRAGALGVPPRHDPALPDDPGDEPGGRLPGAAADDARGDGARRGSSRSPRRWPRSARSPSARRSSPRSPCRSGAG